MQEVHDSANIETFDFGNSLNREYKIDTMSWTSAMAGNTIIGTYNFPQALFSQQFIADKIKDFRFFRGGVRFTMRVAASKFLYGKLLCTFEPISTGLPVLFDLNHASGSPHVIVSASASEAVVFDVPFISMFRALDIRSYNPDEIGRFTVRVLNPLTDINGVANSANVLVTAQFLEAEVFLPHDFVTQSASSVRMSAPMKGAEGRAKASNNIGAGLEDTTNLAAGIAHTTLNEAEHAVFGKKASIPDVAMFAAMGLSKPTSVENGQITKINPNYDVSYGKGISTVQKISMDPENQISTMPIVGGINADEMALEYIMGTPMLVYVSPVISTPAVTAIATLDRDDAQITFVDYISRLFRYVSGSYKFKLYVTASLMHAVRAVIWMSDNANPDWQNCYHIVIDIQGDTEVEFTIPYVGKAVMKKPGDNNEFKLYFTVLSWSQPDPVASTPIYLNLYKAAAPDFRVACYMENQFTPQSNPREDFAKEFAPIHPSVKGYMTQNLVCGEEYTTIREIIHRYAAYRVIDSTVQGVYEKTVVGSPRVGLELLGMLFRFWRGSIRVKTFNNAPAFGAAAIVLDGLYVAGTAIENTNLPQLEFEIPYYTNALFNHTSIQNDNNTVQFRAATSLVSAPGSPTNSYFMKAAGDDFSFHFLCAPPVGFLAPAASGFYLQGFLNFMG